MKRFTMLLAGAALAVSAEASPITSPPSMITAQGGHVKAVYVFADAMDSSVLGLMTPPPMDPIFCNHPTASCATAGAAGNIVDLGARSGALTFTLDNISTGLAYDSANADNDGNYHAKITTNYADFGVGALPTAAAAALAALPRVTFIGFEDRQLLNDSDWDYNDLIFAFSNTASSSTDSSSVTILVPGTPASNSGIPEPLTFGLMAAGLFGAFGLRHSRRS